MVYYVNLHLAQNATLATPLLLRKVCLSDQMTVCYVSFPRHQTVVDSKEAIANHFLPNTLQTWGIIWQETGKFIGTISLMDLDEHQAELGYILNRTFWGQGVMPEAASGCVMQRIGTFPDYKRKFSNLTRKVESITAEQWVITKDMYYKKQLR